MVADVLALLAVLTEAVGCAELSVAGAADGTEVLTTLVMLAEGVCCTTLALALGGDAGTGCSLPMERHTKKPTSPTTSKHRPAKTATSGALELVGTTGCWPDQLEAVLAGTCCRELGSAVAGPNGTTGPVGCCG